MIHSSDREAVVGIGCREPRYAGPMEMVGLRVGVLVHEVVARQDPAAEFGVVGIDSGVEHRESNRCVAAARVPAFDRVDVGARSPARLTGVVEVPLEAEGGVVGDEDTSLADVVGFGVLAAEIGCVEIDHLRHAALSRNREALHAE
jgi:hypothetical protein